MKLRMYTLYDRVAEECGPLFTAKNDGTALRVYNNALKDITTPPEELQLIQVGTIDNITCQIEPQWPTRLVVTAKPEDLSDE